MLLVSVTHVVLGRTLSTVELSSFEYYIFACSVVFQSHASERSGPHRLKLHHRKMLELSENMKILYRQIHVQYTVKGKFNK